MDWIELSLMWNASSGLDLSLWPFCVGAFDYFARRSLPSSEQFSAISHPGPVNIALSFQFLHVHPETQTACKNQTKSNNSTSWYWGAYQFSVILCSRVSIHYRVQVFLKISYGELLSAERAGSSSTLSGWVTERTLCGVGWQYWSQRSMGRGGGGPSGECPSTSHKRKVT